MPDFSNITDRTAAGALVPEEVSNSWLQKLPNESLALSKFGHVTMSRKQTRLPVVDTLPRAYFVDGDIGLTKTTSMAWKNKFLNAEKLAVIVPVPKDLLDDADYDILGSAEDAIVKELARTIDGATMFGIDRPASWDAPIIPTAVARGFVVTEGTNTAAKGGIAGDISDLFAKVEEVGYDVTGVAAKTIVRAKLRTARNAQGDKLPEVTPSEAYGVGISYPARGLWVPVTVGTGEDAVTVDPLAIAGDFTQGVIGLRKDFTWEALREAVITDNDGKVIYNLAQQDMVGIKVTMRVAFAVANTITFDQKVEAARYPFSVLGKAAA